MSDRSRFTDHGVVACAEEPRNAAVCLGRDGRYYLVIGSHGFLLSVDMEARTVRQVMFPGLRKGGRAGNYWPFGALASRAGYFYTGADKLFMEFDPVANEFTHCVRLGDEIANAAFSLCEAPDGRIYFGCVQPYLYGFDPRTRELVCYGNMDETQAYLASLAADDQGWLYCGIATETCSLVAFRPDTGEKRILWSRKGEGVDIQVIQGYGNQAYAIDDGFPINTAPSGKGPLYALRDGAVGKPAERVDCEYAGTGFHTVHRPEASSPRVVSIDVVEHEARYIHPSSGEETTVWLEYESPGAELSPMALGPDGLVYGTTNHPIQIYTYNPDSGALCNYGKRPFAARIGGWGNICAYASQGPILAGAAYCGGFIVRIDTRQSICREPDDVNPHCEAAHPEILRPRSALALWDGRTILFGGFNVNGVTGGCLCLYDTEARTSRIIPNENIARHHSVVSMAQLTRDDVLLGTSVDAPCGGHVRASDALLCRMGMQEEKVYESVCPVPGAKAISLMKSDRRGVIHAITQESVYFAYDPAARKTLIKQDLSQYGAVVRDGMQPAPDGFLYGLLSDAVYRIDTASLRAEIIARPPEPITAGMAIRDGVIYMGCGTRFFSFRI
jgi:hypothetical protein